MKDQLKKKNYFLFNIFATIELFEKLEEKLFSPSDAISMYIKKIMLTLYLNDYDYEIAWPTYFSFYYCRKNEIMQKSIKCEFMMGALTDQVNMTKQGWHHLLKHALKLQDKRKLTLVECKNL